MRAKFCTGHMHMHALVCIALALMHVCILRVGEDDGGVVVVRAAWRASRSRVGVTKVGRRHVRSCRGVGVSSTRRGQRHSGGAAPGGDAVQHGLDAAGVCGRGGRGAGLPPLIWWAEGGVTLREQLHICLVSLRLRGGRSPTRRFGARRAARVASTACDTKPTKDAPYYLTEHHGSR
jgi:hypothetical protein